MSPLPLPTVTPLIEASNVVESKAVVKLLVPVQVLLEFNRFVGAGIAEIAV